MEAFVKGAWSQRFVAASGLYAMRSKFIVNPGGGRLIVLPDLRPTGGLSARITRDAAPVDRLRNPLNPLNKTPGL